MQTISSSPRKAAAHLGSHGFCEDHHSHAKAAGARSAARRTGFLSGEASSGIDGSNPVPSSGESGELRIFREPAAGDP